jgi:hypothetical protein
MPDYRRHIGHDHSIRYSSSRNPANSSRLPRFDARRPGPRLDAPRPDRRVLDETKYRRRSMDILRWAWVRLLVRPGRFRMSLLKQPPHRILGEVGPNYRRGPEFGHLGSELRGEPGSNCPIIGSGLRVDLVGEPAPRRLERVALGNDLREHGGVVVGVADDRYAVMILG